ncbi:hypothetical protein [Actinoallomurus sp. CA-150999]|uniref:hypothetical protein n=1 Tax=Actinoallomurus sp. CA-150999 TaxID=3239887 RepID=UPI003D8EB11B
MRKLAVTMAAALAVVGAGASTASAATTVAKPKTSGSWNLDRKIKPKDMVTDGTWKLDLKKKHKQLTIKVHVHIYSPTDSGDGIAYLRIGTPGHYATKKVEPFGKADVRKTLVLDGKAATRIYVRKCRVLVEPGTTCSPEKRVK